MCKRRDRDISKRCGVRTMRALPHAAAFALEGLAVLAILEYNGRAAASFLGAATALRRAPGAAVGVPFAVGARGDTEEVRAAAIRLVGDEPFSTAFAEAAGSARPRHGWLTRLSAIRLVGSARALPRRARHLRSQADVLVAGELGEVLPGEDQDSGEMPAGQGRDHLLLLAFASVHPGRACGRDLTAGSPCAVRRRGRSSADRQRAVSGAAERSGVIALANQSAPDLGTEDGVRYALRV